MRVQTNDLMSSSHCYRKLLIMIIAILPSVLIGIPTVVAEGIAAPMQVYKSPTCGCCTAWVKQIKQSGFNTAVHHPSDINVIKQQLNVAPAYRACHTATLHGYVFEGHIPTDVIQRFITDKSSDAIGLAVVGMPLGSPGMDTQGKFQPYQVLQLLKNGRNKPYAKISASKTLYLETSS